MLVDDQLPSARAAEHAFVNSQPDHRSSWEADDGLAAIDVFDHAWSPEGGAAGHPSWILRMPTATVWRRRAVSWSVTVSGRCPEDERVRIIMLTTFGY